MRTTVNLDEALVEEAQRLTGTMDRNGADPRRPPRVDCSRECPPSGAARWKRTPGHGAAPTEILLILVDTSVWIDHLRRGDFVLFETPDKRLAPLAK